MRFEILLISFCLSVCLSADPEEMKQKWIERMRQTKETCAKQANANEDDMKELQNFQVPTRKEGKAVLACMMKAFGTLNADGKLDRDGIMRTVEGMKEAKPDMYEKVKAMMEKCLAEVTNGADENETAANFFACESKYKKEMGIGQPS